MYQSPSIVPEASDRDIYLVLDDFGARGRSWRETDEGNTDGATVVRDLLDGQILCAGEKRSMRCRPRCF
jgi:hypothetical protein